MISEKLIWTTDYVVSVNLKDTWFAAGSKLFQILNVGKYMREILLITLLLIFQQLLSGADSFLHIVPENIDSYNLERSRPARILSAYHDSIKYDIIKDSSVTDDDLKNNNLFVFGDSSSNRITDRILGKTELKYTLGGKLQIREKIHPNMIGLILRMPNPFNPQKKAYICGDTFSRYSDDIEFRDYSEYIRKNHLEGYDLLVFDLCGVILKGKWHGNRMVYEDVLKQTLQKSELTFFQGKHNKIIYSPELFKESEAQETSQMLDDYYEKTLSLIGYDTLPEEDIRFFYTGKYRSFTYPYIPEGKKKALDLFQKNSFLNEKSFQRFVFDGHSGTTFFCSGSLATSYGASPFEQNRLLKHKYYSKVCSSFIHTGIAQYLTDAANWSETREVFLQKLIAQCYKTADLRNFTVLDCYIKYYFYPGKHIGNTSPYSYSIAGYITKLMADEFGLKKLKEFLESFSSKTQCDVEYFRQSFFKVFGVSFDGFNDRWNQHVIEYHEKYKDVLYQSLEEFYKQEKGMIITL